MMDGTPPPRTASGAAAGGGGTSTPRPRRKGPGIATYHHLGNIEAGLKNLGFSDVADDSMTVKRLSSKLSPAAKEVLLRFGAPAGTGCPSARAGDGFMGRKKSNSERASRMFGGSAQDVVFGAPIPQNELGRREAREGRFAQPSMREGSRAEHQLALERDVANLTKGRVVSSKLFQHVTDVVDSDPKLRVLAMELNVMDTDADGFLTPSEARRALGKVGVVVSETDALAMADAVGAAQAYSRDGPARINSDKFMSAVKSSMSSTPLESVSSSGSITRKAAKHRITERLIAPHVDVPAGVPLDTERRSGKGGVSEAVFSPVVAQSQGAAASFTDVHSPMGQAYGAHMMERHRRDLTRNSVVEGRLVDRVLGVVNDDRNLDLLSDAMRMADYDGDGLLSPEQFQEALSLVGVTVSKSDAAAIGKTVGAQHIEGGVHIAPDRVIRGLHRRLAACSGSSLPLHGESNDLVDDYGAPLSWRSSVTSGPRSIASAPEGDALIDARGRPIARRRHVVDDDYSSAAGSTSYSARGDGGSGTPHATRSSGKSQPVSTQAIRWGTAAMSSEQLHAIKQRCRDALPVQDSSAASVLRRALKRADGDGDGQLSAAEVANGMRLVMGADTSSSDVMGIIADIVSRRDDSAKRSQGGVFGSTSGVDNVSVDELTAFVLGSKPQSAHGIEGWDGGAWHWLAEYGGHECVPVSSQVGQDGTTSSAIGLHAKTRRPRSKSVSSARRPDRFAYTAAHKANWNRFRVGWEARHGPAATKELRRDASRVPPGPSWDTDKPKPFRVVKPVLSPPEPPRSRPSPPVKKPPAPRTDYRGSTIHLG